jgi:hypothetical protein
VSCGVFFQTMYVKKQNVRKRMYQLEQLVHVTKARLGEYLEQIIMYKTGT